MTPDTNPVGRRIVHTHRTLFRAGLVLVSAFAWVFVFQFALAFSRNESVALLVALLVYALSQATLLFATPLSATHLRHGMKRAMIFGTLLAALAFVVLGGTISGYFQSPIGWGLVLFGILLGAYRALYWIPYRLQETGPRREPNMFVELLLSLLPAFAGVTLATVYISSLRLLFGAAALMILSIVPLLFLRDSGEPFAWGYAQTFAKLFDQRYRRLTLRCVLVGAESTAVFIVWPLSVFLIVNGSYLEFGFVVSASFLVLLALRGLYRRFRRSLPSSPTLDVAFAVSGWILRLAAGSPLMIVFADSYSYVSAPSGGPDFVLREHASDGGSYIDEYTALQEIAMAFGRIIMCAFAALLLFTMQISIALACTLIAAALAAGAATVVARNVKIEAY